MNKETTMHFVQTLKEKTELRFVGLYGDTMASESYTFLRITIFDDG